jgi:ABC-type iron transport system FetAB permease component
MSLNDSPLGLRLDLGLVNMSFVPSAGDEIPGMRAGGRPRLRIPALVSVVNYVFSLAFASGRLVMIGVDVVLLAHNYSQRINHEEAKSTKVFSALVFVPFVSSWLILIVSRRLNAT